MQEVYEGFQIQPNCLQTYYPKMVQRHLQKRKNQNTDRIVHGLRPPTLHGSEINRKAVDKMKLLTRCQANFMQVVLQKIDRRSKPIKKQEKILNHNLKKKSLFLEEENFDILTLLSRNQPTIKNDLKSSSILGKNEKKDQAKNDEHQDPMSILKSKPLKSERDRQQVEREKQINQKSRKSHKSSKNQASGFKVPES